MISTSRMSCSRILRRRMKWVGTPISFNRLKIYSEMRLFRTPFAFEAFMLLGVEGCRIVLEVLDERAGLRPFIKNLRLPLINTAAAVIHG